MGYNEYFYTQLAEDNQIHGYNIAWGAEHTNIIANSEFLVDGEAGIPGTHLSVSSIHNKGGGDNVIVFYQTEGSDITEYTRDLITGQWSEVAIPIPIA